VRRRLSAISPENIWRATLPGPMYDGTGVQGLRAWLAVKSPNDGATMRQPGRVNAVSKMKKRLAICLWLIMTATAVALPGGRAPIEGNLIPAGLTGDPAATPAPVETPAPEASPVPASSSCADDVTFTRSLKYGADAMNVLDVASGQIRPGV